MRIFRRAAAAEKMTKGANLTGDLCAQLRAQIKIRLRAMAGSLAVVCAVVAAVAIPTTSHARSLSLSVQVKKDFYTPLVPVTKNFRTCFKVDPATGTQVLGLCTDEGAAPARAPAAAKPVKPARPAAPAVRR